MSCPREINLLLTGEAPHRRFFKGNGACGRDGRERYFAIIPDLYYNNTFLRFLATQGCTKIIPSKESANDHD
jgi:hypothetical protein